MLMVIRHIINHTLEGGCGGEKKSILVCVVSNTKPLRLSVTATISLRFS